MKFLPIAFIFQLLLLSAVYGTDRFCNNITELNTAIGAAAPGDNIILKNGIWNNAAITFSSSGNATNPIIMRAETAGSVTFSGNSTLTVTGTYLVVKGFRWTNGTVTGNVVTLKGGNNRLTQCAMINYNSGSKWIVLDGLRCRVDHCHFEGKNTIDPTMQIEVKDKTADYHMVDYNHFAKREPLGANGGETVRVGYSGQMDNISRTIFQYNLFQECDGENEIISNKSCENLYQFNTFRRSIGQFCFRHGDRNILYSNFFLGEGKANTGGVRVIGSQNYVINNFFHGLDAANSTGDAVIILQKGQTYPAGEVRFNPQINGCVIAYNTVVDFNSGKALDVNNGGRPLSPTGVKVANNLFVDASETLVANNLTGSETWLGNMYLGTLGITNPGGFTSNNPQFEAAGSWRIGAASPAIDAGVGGWGTLLDIAGLGVDVNLTKDIDGQTRSSQKDVGADERATGTVTNRPLNPVDVGPAFLGGPADPDEPATATNLALNKSTTTSSQPQPENPASSAVDGNTVTRWSASVYPQWVEVDLGAEYSINKTEVVCFSDRAYQFKVEAKTTPGGTFTQVVNRTTNTTPGTVAAPITNTFTPMNARYVRITVTGCSGYTGTWASISEFRVFGVTPAPLMIAATAKQQEEAPVELSVYPNPVAQSNAMIRYTVKEATQVSLIVYNINGQGEVLVNTRQQPGNYAVKWDAAKKQNGVYIAKLKTGNKEKDFRIILSK